VADDLEGLLQAFPLRRLEDLQVDEIGSWLRALADDNVTPAQLLRLGEIERCLAEVGLAPVWEDIRQRKPAPELWPDRLRHVWLTSSIEEVHLSDPSIPAFRGRYHDKIAAEFRSLDAGRLDLAVQRVRRAHAQAATEARNRFPTQDILVSREAEKKSKHLPLRRLFSDAPNVLLALRPCWMASPLSVSQIIPGDRPHFDVVVFDEASQVLPEDAVTSLLRGRGAVVAGDRRQLPPTTFFAAGDDELDADESGATGGFESILDVMSAFLDPAWSLDWHYRSRDEALIAYSNHRIYGGRLITFPGPGLRKAVRHELVAHDPNQAGQEQSSSREVRRVVELIMKHARERPAESLGVITMGITHAKRIEMELDRERQGRADVEEFFAANKSERFFVKNLERVQGDEREAIILSVGYSKNEAGRLVYRFGPLLQQGGERRLNVAITRARRRMTVVSSFSHVDMDPEYPKDGVRHLRAYLEYAASGGRSLGLGAATDVPLNDFEQSVFDALTARGLKLVGQVGSSKYRIDIVAMHPEKPGRFVLAIECDGASYHSAPTARDRDRLRQQQLEALSWRFCRIWSTDWFLRREEEIQRVLKAFEAALRLAGAEDARGDGPRSQPQPIPAVPVQATAPAVAAVRIARPLVAPGLPIADYAPRQLQDMVRWVQSDGKLRTDEEILSEVVHELGFLRRGTRIVETVNAAIQSVRRDERRY
jgi:very-short-patch-repair endonuclease